MWSNYIQYNEYGNHAAVLSTSAGVETGKRGGRKRAYTLQVDWEGAAGNGREWWGMAGSGGEWLGMAGNSREQRDAVLIYGNLSQQLICYCAADWPLLMVATLTYPCHHHMAVVRAVAVAMLVMAEVWPVPNCPRTRIKNIYQTKSLPAQPPPSQLGAVPTHLAHMAYQLANQELLPLEQPVSLPAKHIIQKALAGKILDLVPASFDITESTMTYMWLLECGNAMVMTHSLALISISMAHFTFPALVLPDEVQCMPDKNAELSAKHQALWCLGAECNKLDSILKDLEDQTQLGHQLTAAVVEQYACINKLYLDLEMCYKEASIPVLSSDITKTAAKPVTNLIQSSMEPISVLLVSSGCLGTNVLNFCSHCPVGASSLVATSQEVDRLQPGHKHALSCEHIELLLKAHWQKKVITGCLAAVTPSDPDTSFCLAMFQPTLKQFLLDAVGLLVFNYQRVHYDGLIHFNVGGGHVELEHFHVLANKDYHDSDLTISDDSGNSTQDKDGDLAVRYQDKDNLYEEEYVYEYNSSDVAVGCQGSGYKEDFKNEVGDMDD
ncbi:hypothetical protein OE88DRAFT_1649113 [Heliocybe sulcata]|uniref:Uncharacterized protein n=1 Tax=Heliocybe sulcata TaxID=5364 RepID=A0A5C3MKA0_9AGAM|nr:hypothetical protein OE88DRAFT_1649113 [Heliocybe sulcata]